jgi:hypothetical protein
MTSFFMKLVSRAGVAVLAVVLPCVSAASGQAIFTTAPGTVVRVEPSRSQQPQGFPAPLMQPQRTAGAPLQLPSAPRAPTPAATFDTRPLSPMTTSAIPRGPAIGPSPSPAAMIVPPKAAPAAAAPVAPAPPPAQSAAPHAPVAMDTLRGPVLRHLTNNVQGFRLAGEIASSEWPVYLTDAQARRKLQFKIGYLSAVSVMPEASTLTLTVNDEVVGETPVKATGSVRTVVFDIAPGVMRPGFNSIRISTEQRHRVDCSVEATYELWTQIDATETGLLLDGAEASIESLADLAALLPDDQGALPIRAVLPQKARAPDVERMMRATQLISILGRFDQPVVDLGGLAQGQYGVNLAVGSVHELDPEVTRLLPESIDRPLALVLPATSQRRATIILTGANGQQVEEAMKQFLVATAMKGSPAGLRAAAAFPGYRLEGGRRVKLRDLGVVSEEFTGRLYRAAFNIIMPPDFYAADYGRATVRLAGGYAPGLTQRAQLVMKVNDRTAVSLNLLKASGETFTDNQLPLPLGFLRPGLNRVEIEAHVPTKEDGSCDPLAAIHAGNRFLFLDRTEIEIPAIARVARMPDLAVTFTGGFPFAGSPRRPKLFLPSFERKSIGAAATVAAHLAIAAGHPIDFEITVSAPTGGKSPTLAVGPMDAFDQAILTRLDVPVSELRDAWKFKSAGRSDDAGRRDQSGNRFVLENNFPSACHPQRFAPTRSGSGRSAQRDRDDLRELPSRSRLFRDIDPTVTGTVLRQNGDSDVDEAQRDIFAAWDARVKGEGRWLSTFTGFLERTREWSVSKFTDAARQMRVGFELDAEEPLVTPTSSLAIAQNLLSGGSEDVWTLVTAFDSDTLADSVACLVDPRVSRQVAGRVSVLDMATAKVHVLPVTDARFIVTQPLSVSNVRLIAAGWLSLHSLEYVFGAFCIAAALAAATRIFVREAGRRSR